MPFRPAAARRLAAASVRSGLAVAGQRALVALLAAGLLFAGCAPAPRVSQSRQAIRSGTLRLSDKQLLQARAVLLRLPLYEQEAFPDFLPRARAVLISDLDVGLQAVAHELPDDPSVKLAPALVQIMPLLVGRWASGYRQKERVELLQHLVRRPTVTPAFAEGVAPPPLDEPSPAGAADGGGDVVEEAVAASAVPPEGAGPGPETGPRASPEDALAGFVLDLQGAAVALGLRWRDEPGPVLEVSIPPQEPIAAAVEGRPGQPEPFAMLLHADVAPVDQPGWYEDPFSGQLLGGKLFGRGALDDKGPLVAALYTLAALQRSRLWLTRGARVVVGTRGESEGAAVADYLGHRPLPVDALIVDGQLPTGLALPAAGGSAWEAALAEGWALIQGRELPRTERLAGPYEGLVPHAAAFGPSLEGNTRRAHRPNEYFAVVELDALVELYAYALCRMSL